MNPKNLLKPVTREGCRKCRGTDPYQNKNVVMVNTGEQEKKEETPAATIKTQIYTITFKCLYCGTEQTEGYELNQDRKIEWKDSADDKQNL